MGRMSWKDKWTAFIWKITYPGEPVPDYVLPSYMERERKEEAKQKKELESRSPEDVMTRLILMDMEMYPNEWKQGKDKYDNYFRIENAKASIKIVINQLTFSRPNEFCRINDIEVGKVNSDRIKKGFENRDLADVLERLLDRVQKVETVTFEEVKAEARKDNLVDPFAEDNLKKLESAMKTLKEAAVPALPKPKLNTITKQLPVYTTSSSTKKVNKKDISKLQKKHTVINLKPHLPEVAHFCGKPISKLNEAEFNQFCKFMEEAY